MQQTPAIVVLNAKTWHQVIVIASCHDVASTALSIWCWYQFLDWIFHSLKVFSTKYAIWNTPLELWQKRHQVRNISCCLRTQSTASLSLLDLGPWIFSLFHTYNTKDRAWGEGRNGRQVVNWRCLSEKSYRGSDWNRVLCMTFNYTGASGDCTHPCTRRCQYAAEEGKKERKRNS